MVVFIEFQIEARFMSEKNNVGLFCYFWFLVKDVFIYFVINCWQIIIETHRLNYKKLDDIKESVKLRV
jgi:hypothetical protein